MMKIVYAAACVWAFAALLGCEGGGLRYSEAWDADGDPSIPFDATE